MKNFYISFRTLFKKGRHNDIKILSLGVGLAMGLVLIAKVCFELSYDNFYPESDRIFAIQENFSIGDKSNDGFPCVSGGVAPGMKAEIPGVVAATRCERTGEMVMKTPDNKKYTAIFMLASTTSCPAKCWSVMPVRRCRAPSMPLFRKKWPAKSTPTEQT